VDAVEHRPRCAVPFREDEQVAGAERVNRVLQLRAVLDVLAGCLLAEDLVTMLRAKRGDLPIEILMGR
jgi:hypothetical protein